MSVSHFYAIRIYLQLFHSSSQESQQGSLSSPETQGDSGQTSPHSLASESPSLPPTLSTNGKKRPSNLLSPVLVKLLYSHP